MNDKTMNDIKVGQIWIVKIQDGGLSKMEVKEKGERYVGLYQPGIPMLSGVPFYYELKDVLFLERV